MSVRVQLDRQHGDIYTNLDFVSGKVLLTLPTEATISAITVKLEGESKTKLDGPKSPMDQDRKKTLLEVHKLLYKVETVFPSAEVREVGLQVGKTAQYTLYRGQYEYPFQFKLPFNSDCINNTSLIKDLKVGQLSVQFGQEPLHAKLPLPPSLGGYPGEAEIKYFIKATVVRPKFYQENLRNEIPVTFLPIELPRPAKADGETYGRRKHQFQRTQSGQYAQRKFSRSTRNETPDEEPLSFQVEARLPNPAIVTCREPLPLRILIERLNNSTSTIYLSMLQIELIGTTEVRAHDLMRRVLGTWLLFSQANMSVALEHPSNKTNLWTVPSRFWDNVPLPPTVAPTFKTCNLSRKYELEVRVGLTHGMADGVRPEIVVSPIRLDVEVYSGIRPPPQLLEAMTHSQDGHRPSYTPTVNFTGGNETNHDMRMPSGQQYPTRISPVRSSSQPQYTPPAGRPPNTNPSSGEFDDDLPPSYEDAMAGDIAPVDGHRPSGYSTEGQSPQQPAFNSDRKTSLGRRVSERLFSSNSPTHNNSRSTRMGSGDMSRSGGDIVHEEPDDMNEMTTSTSRLGINADLEDENRPPLPMRRPSENKIDAGGGSQKRV